MTVLGLRRSLGQLKKLGRLGPNTPGKGGGGGGGLSDPVFWQDHLWAFITDEFDDPIEVDPRPEPSMTSSSFFSVEENVQLSFTLTADVASIFAITGGADAADFEISGSTLRWAGNGTKDFEAGKISFAVQVTPTNGLGVSGTAQAITGALLNVDDTPPSISSVTISDTTPEAYQTITVTAVATGAPTPTLAYQWQQDTAGNLAFASISGATSTDFTVPVGSVGNSLRCVVTATGFGAPAVLASSPTSAVASALPSMTDNFNRPDEDLEANANWVRVDGSAGMGRVVGNVAISSTTDALGAAYQSAMDVGSPNHYAEANFISGGGNASFLCCRLTNRNNFIGLRLNSTNNGLQVFERIGGTLTLRASYTITHSASNVYRLEVSGSTATVKVNGVTQTPASGTTAISGTLPSSTRQGFVPRSAVSSFMDNYKAGAL